VRLPINQNEHHTAANTQASIVSAEHDFDAHRARADAPDGERRRKQFAETAGGSEINIQVHGWQAPAALRDEVWKRELQSFAAPVFYDVVEYFQIARIENDPGRIAVAESHQDFRAKGPGWR